MNNEIKTLQGYSKKQLIKYITSHHPAYKAGIQRGWSWYVGGMRDTGDWYLDKLLVSTKKQLYECAYEMLKEDSSPSADNSGIDMETHLETLFREREFALLNYSTPTVKKV